jgi:SAM-dependent methyltransferase
MFTTLQNIYKRLAPFEVQTVDKLWTTPHIARNMLKAHLDPLTDAASRKKAFIDRTARFIEQTFHISEGKAVIDFGCGPGLYTTEFAKHGACVTGVDFSSNSIEYARESAGTLGLDIDYVIADYLTFEAEKEYDLATLIYCDYCAISPVKRSQLLKVINSSLKNSGYFLLDVHTMFMYDRLKEGHGISYHADGEFFSEKPHFVLTNKYLYPEQHVSLDHYTIIEEDQTWDIYNWLQYFTKESIAAELSAAGFEVIDFYENVAGDAFRGENDVMAMLCRKVR